MSNQNTSLVFLCINKDEIDPIDHIKFLGFIEKPFLEHELKNTIELIFQKIQLHLEFKAREDQFVNIRERYKSLFDESMDAVYIHDFQGNILDANDNALEMLGYSRADLTNLNISSILPQDQLLLAR